MAATPRLIDNGRVEYVGWPVSDQTDRHNSLSLSLSHCYSFLMQRPPATSFSDWQSSPDNAVRQFRPACSEHIICITRLGRSILWLACFCQAPVSVCLFSIPSYSMSHVDYLDKYNRHIRKHSWEFKHWQWHSVHCQTKPIVQEEQTGLSRRL